MFPCCLCHHLGLPVLFLEMGAFEQIFFVVKVTSDRRGVHSSHKFDDFFRQELTKSNETFFSRHNLVLERLT